MGKFLPCPLPCDSDKKQDSDNSQGNQLSDSSSNSSLTSHSSLPSVPSLQRAASAAVAAANYHCLATLKGHSSYVFSLALAGKHLYSGASDGEIRVWDRNPSSSIHGGAAVVARSGSAVKAMIVLGDKLVTAHSDHRIRVWRSEGTGGKIRLAATLPTAADSCMRLFSARNYVEVRRHKRITWVHHADAVSALAASPDGSLLYSASWDRSVKVWRSSDFRCLESLQNAHEDAINAVAAAADGTLYTGSADKTIKVWRRRDGDRRHSLVATLEKHRSAVNALALSADGSVLYSGACDRSIIVWEKGGGGEMAVAGALRGHKKSILCLAAVAEVVCSGSADRSVRVWRRGSGGSYSCLAVVEGHKSPVKCLIAGLDRNYSEIKKNEELGNSYLVYSGGLDFDIRISRVWVPF